MIVALEFLFHFYCEECSRWWSVADVFPGETIICPHCGHRNTIEKIQPHSEDKEKIMEILKRDISDNS
jgi:rRNA maturation endonuclease Nob1